jgi:hypothetical protein
LPPLGGWVGFENSYRIIFYYVLIIHQLRLAKPLLS